MVPFDRGRHWTPVKLYPYGGGPRSFWSCYNCCNYDPVRTQIVAPTLSGSREKGGIAAWDSVTLGAICCPN